MTAEHEERCDEQHAALAEELHEVAKLVEFHSAEVHNQLVPRSEIVEMIDVLSKQVKKNSDTLSHVFTELVGPLHPLTGERRHEYGISDRVEKLWHMAQNGGVNARLGRKELGAIWLAVVAAVANILIAVLGAS